MMLSFVLAFFQDKCQRELDEFTTKRIEKVHLGVLTPTCVVLEVFVGFCGSLSADISKLSSISVQLVGRSLGGFFQTFSGYLLFDLLVICWR